MKIYPFVTGLLVTGLLAFLNGNLMAEKEHSLFAAEKVTLKDFQTRRDEPVKPLEAPKVADQAMVELGKKLFFDPRLSTSGFMSCNSCHNLSMGGSDNLKTSVGHNLRKGAINAPTVLNASLNFVQFWDGRAKNFKELLTVGDYAYGGKVAFIEGKNKPSKQSDILPRHSRRVTFTHDIAVAILRSIPLYVEEFSRVFQSARIDIAQMITALTAFEETLVTPNSRFDQWLSGNDNAITRQELAGYELFKSSGCTNCHNGPSLGGNSFQKIGVVEPYKSTNASTGRFAVTKIDADRFKFKVPTLRNVELTYPYFHDGGAATLSKAVEVMGQIQSGKKFTADENAGIVAFLKSLTGDQPKFELPHLPPSSDTTPPPRNFGN